jgi:ribosomal protein S1
MKKAIAIIVSALFVLSVAGLSFAAEKKAPAEKKAKVHTVTGEVVAVDAAAMTVTVKGRKGEVALSTTDKTKFAKGKSLADVKVGEKATVKYVEEDGKNTAKSVMVKATHAKKEMKKEMKKEAAPAEKPMAAPAEKKTGGY